MGKKSISIFRRQTSKTKIVEKGDFSPFSFRLLADGVGDAARLVHLDLALGHEVAQRLAGGGRLTRSDVQRTGDGVAGHRLGLLGQELEDSVLATGSFLLLLGEGGLALGVLLVQLANEGLAGGVHLLGEVSVKNGLEVLASGHGLFLSALHAL